MPVITQVKPQRNGKRVNIYLDDKFGFGIDLDNFVTLGLEVGKEYRQEEIEKIIKKAEFQKTLDKLLKFTTLRPRSEKEIQDWFGRKKVHESLRRELFNRLKRLDLVNDKKFARWWIDQRLNFRPKAKRILAQELKIKGIDKDTISEVLGEVKIDEVKIAKELLAKKAYKWKGLEPRLAGQKMSQYLVQKGFDWEIINKLIAKEI